MHALRHIALATFLLATSAAHAAESHVVNGSLTGQIENNGLPAGWTIFAGTPDVMDALNNVGQIGTTRFGAAPAASPDGGTWVGLGADVDFIERFGQTLTGLTVGQAYTVSWFAGNFGYDSPNFKYLGTNAISVMVDDELIGSGAALSLGSDWYAQSVSFTAKDTTQLLSFTLATSTKAYMSIDGIAVTTSAVPEPATWMLMGLSLVGMSGVMRRRTRA